MTTTALRQPAVATRRTRPTESPDFGPVQPALTNFESDVRLGKVALYLIALLFMVLFLIVPLTLTLIGNL